MLRPRKPIRGGASSRCSWIWSLSEQVAEFHLNAVLDANPAAMPLDVMNEVLARIKGKSAQKKTTKPRSKTKDEVTPDLPSSYDGARDAGWLPPKEGFGAPADSGKSD